MFCIRNHHDLKEGFEMSDYEKKIFKALLEIEKSVEKLDKVLEKLGNTGSKAKHFAEQEKAIHEIKKIAREYDKIEKFEEKDILAHAERIRVGIHVQEKALLNIAKAADTLEKDLSKISDDDNKVKSFIAHKKITHQVKRILHNCGLFEAYVEDEVSNIL